MLQFSIVNYIHNTVQLLPPSISRTFSSPRTETLCLLNSNSLSAPPLISVQFSSVAQLCPTLCNPMDCTMPDFPVHHQLLELAQTHVHRVGDAIQPSHPLSSPSPSAFSLPQHQGLFQWDNSSHRVAKVLEFQLQHQSFQWISGLISFRIDWLDLLVVQGTLKSLFQHYSSKASVLQHSAFFIVQLSHPYMTTGKTIALIRRTFVGKVMSLLFNMLSAQRLKNLPGMRETWVWSLGQEDPLEKEMTTYSSILA